jgi:hypothetical protein
MWVENEIPFANDLRDQFDVCFFDIPLPSPPPPSCSLVHELTSADENVTPTETNANSKALYREPRTRGETKQFLADPTLFKQREHYPPLASQALLVWYRANILWPYPNFLETKQLAEESGLNVLQVKNWFINYRKRHWSKLFGTIVPRSKKAVEVFVTDKFGSLGAGIKCLREL